MFQKLGSLFYFCLYVPAEINKLVIFYFTSEIKNKKKILEENFPSLYLYPSHSLSDHWHTEKEGWWESCVAIFKQVRHSPPSIMISSNVQTNDIFSLLLKMQKRKKKRCVFIELERCSWRRLKKKLSRMKLRIDLPRKWKFVVNRGVRLINRYCCYRHQRSVIANTKRERERKSESERTNERASERESLRSLKRSKKRRRDTLI